MQLDLLVMSDAVPHILRDREHTHIISSHTFAERAHLANVYQGLVIANLVDEFLEVLAVGVRFVVGEEHGLIELLHFVYEGQRVVLLVSLEVLGIEAIVLVCFEKIDAVGNLAVGVPPDSSCAILHIKLLRII